MSATHYITPADKSAEILPINQALISQADITANHLKTTNHVPLSQAGWPPDPCKKKPTNEYQLSSTISMVPSNESEPSNTSQPKSKNQTTTTDSENPANQNTIAKFEKPANEAATTKFEKPANEAATIKFEKPANEAAAMKFKKQAKLYRS